MELKALTTRTTTENHKFLNDNDLDITWVITALIDEIRTNPKKLESIKKEAANLKRQKTRKKHESKFVTINGKTYSREELAKLLP